jgi:mono/diheme cytochrome c family protein
MTWLRVLLLLGSALATGGCERRMHNMYEQPRLDRDEHSPLFADGRATRPPPPGSVVHAMGTLAATSSGRHGDGRLAAIEAADRQTALPSPVDPRLLVRGQAQFQVFCMPCHGAAGDGDGLVVQRGFPAPPSLHMQRLRQAPDRYFYDVITHGHGIMYSYADRIDSPDRWAVVAYLRALQRSGATAASTAP